MPGGFLPIRTKPGNVEVVRRFQDTNVSFLIIGGITVAVHGCRDFMDVDDLDIMIDPHIDNAGRVMSALTSIHANCVISNFTNPAQQIPVKWQHFYLDILTPKIDVDFASLKIRSVLVSMDDMRIPVVGRDDLIALKEEVVSQPGCNPKHLRDLECLKAARS